MPSWMILAAPLLIAALALLLAFAGCGLSESGTGFVYFGEITGVSSLVSYWRLGEAAGATVAADSKDGNAGKYNGGVTLGVPGLLCQQANTEGNTAAQFDGSSGYVSVPLTPALNPAQFTVEVLVKIGGGAGTLRSIVSSTHVDAKTGNKFGYGVQISAKDQWQGFAGDGTKAFKVAQVGKVGAAAVGGGPFYVALTYDGTTLTLYVNPTNDQAHISTDQVGSVAASVKQNTSTELRIGAGANDGPAKQLFTGVLDEVAIYNAALPYDTVRSHFGVMLTSSKFS